MIESLQKDLEDLVVDHERLRITNYLDGFVNWEHYRSVTARGLANMFGEGKGSNIHWPWDKLPTDRDRRMQWGGFQEVLIAARVTQWISPNHKKLYGHVHFFCADHLDYSQHGLMIYCNDGVNNHTIVYHHDPFKVFFAAALMDRTRRFLKRLGVI